MNRRLNQDSSCKGEATRKDLDKALEHVDTEAGRLKAQEVIRKTSGFVAALDGE